MPFQLEKGRPHPLSSRYLRNKWFHFYELNSDLQAVFGTSRHGLVKYCDGLIKGGSIVFQLWKAINGNLTSMKAYFID